MQKPPDRKTPPILFARGGSDWIRRLGQKHKQLIELRLSAEQREGLERWTETEFVYMTLDLAGESATRDQIARVASGDSDAQPGREIDREAMAVLVSLRKASSLARANGKNAELTAEFLLELHGEPEAGFRKSAGDVARATAPVSPEHLPAFIESVCRWCTAESFAELNPVEQSSIVLLRLIDLQPFDQANERTALVAASLFTLRSDLPPIILRPEMRAAYADALNEGARMNTQPMVALVAQAVEQSVSEMIEHAGKKK